MSARKVSAILLNWKRPNEVDEIESHLLRFPFIDEVIVWNNAIEPNLIVYARFFAALDAKNETIYVQDDDCIVESIESLYNVYDGTKLVNGMKRERMEFYRGRDSLVGWGAFFERSWIDCLEEYIQIYGKDAVLYREADRIFTSLLRVGRSTVEASIKDFPSAMAPFALSMQGNHESTKSLALHRCAEIIRGRL